MRILIAAHVPNRREGGVAGIVYGVGEGLERRHYDVEYLFAGDLPTATFLPSRFAEVKFAIELARFIYRDPSRYSVVIIHAPAGWAYGTAVGFLRACENAAQLISAALHGLEERRVRNLGREGRKGKAFHFNFKNRMWHRLYHMPRFYLSIKTANHALCVGREVCTILQLKYDIDADRTSYCPTGVAERFSYEENTLGVLPRDCSSPAHGSIKEASFIYAMQCELLRANCPDCASRLPGAVPMWKQ